MPASSSQDGRESEGAVRAAALRLARPCGEGAAVIERAAILAEGSPSAAIEAWVIAHGGRPETSPSEAAAPGLYGLRSVAGRGLAPRRYVLPATALQRGS
jgi:hypothetical protein